MVLGVARVADDSAWGEKVASHLGLKDEKGFSSEEQREELSRWRNRKYKSTGVKKNEPCKGPGLFRKTVLGVAGARGL